MLGRGILRNPELTDIIESGGGRIDVKKLRHSMTDFSGLPGGKQWG